MATTQTASLNDFLKSNYEAAYGQSMAPYYERMQYPLRYMTQNNIDPDTYGQQLLAQWQQELGALPETGFTAGGASWNLDIPQEEFFKKYFGPESGWSGAGNASYDPATGQVSYKTFDDEFDFGNVLLGAGMAGVGALSGGFGLGELFGGSGAGMTGSIEELVSPNTFSGWSSEGGGMDWINELLQSSGELGADPAALEGGFNSFSGIPAEGDVSQWFSGMSPSQLGTSNGGTMPDIGGGGGLMNLLSQVFGKGAPGSYQFPWGTVLSSLLGYAGNRSSAKDLNSLMQQIMAAQDPFASQRPRYQGQLAELTSKPSNFFQDPAIAEAINQAMGLSNRSLASQGYNSSGNQMAELTKVAQNEAFKQYIPYLNQIGGFAGAGFGPGNMASAGAVGQAGITAENQGLGNLGVGLQAVLSGKQPNLLEMLRGSTQNQSLIDVFKNALG